jgi:hypothetical protein
MSNTKMRLHGLLSQEFIDGAGVGAYLDGFGLWLVVTERGRRYELRDGTDPSYVADAKKMTIDLVRRRALEMREEHELGDGRMSFGKPLKPADLARFVSAWVSASIAAAAERVPVRRLQAQGDTTGPCEYHDGDVTRRIQ